MALRYEIDWTIEALLDAAGLGQAGTNLLTAKSGASVAAKALPGAYAAITAVTGVASTDTFTKTAHGLVNGDAVVLSSLSGGAGLFTDGRPYFVVASAANTFQLAVTSGGAAVNFTSDVVSVSVTKTILLTVYTTETGGGTTAQPLSSETGTGRIEGYVEAPDCDLTVYGASLTTYTQPVRRSPAGIFNVKSYGARGDGTTDDRAAIQATIDALPAQGGKILSPPGDYVCGSALDLDDTIGVTLEGVGGVSSGAQTATRLKFTATGSSPHISARSSTGLRIADINIVYTHASYTGKLISLAHSGTGGDSQMAIIERCFIGGSSASGAAALVLLDKAISCGVRDCTFGAGVLAIKGKDASINYSNMINVERCQFVGQTTSAIRNAGQAWAVRGCTFEQLAGGAASAYSFDYTSSGLSFDSCWFGDASASGNWIDWSGSGLRVVGCYVSTGAKGINISGSSNFGIHVSGNQFGSMTTAVDLGTGQKRCFVMGNDYSSVTTLIAAGDHPEQSMLEYAPASTFEALDLTRHYNESWQQHVAGHIGLTEIADPGNTAANEARLYVKDNGAGKTQLVVVYATGAVQVLNTQP